METDIESTMYETLGEVDIYVTNLTKWVDKFLEYPDVGDWMQATSIAYAEFPVDEFERKDKRLTNASVVHDAVVREHALVLS